MRIFGVIVAVAGVGLTIFSLPTTWLAFIFFVIVLVAIVVGVRLAMGRRAIASRP